MDKFWVRIWNPATQLRSKKSPAFSIGDDRRFGFGYDDSRDTYKVVVLSEYPSHGKVKTETMVYCMGDSHWRNILSDPGIPLSLMWSDGQFVGGCVNWLTEDPNNLYEHIGDSEDDECNDIIQMAIVLFDMREETYRFLSLPDTGGVPYTSIGFGVLGDCLCLYYDHEETHFIVWQMRDFEVRESWTRLMSVSYAHLRCEEYTFYLPNICFCEDGDILMLIHGFKAIKYNLRENSVKHVQHPDNKLWLNVKTYVQSLVLPR
ncbi:F-box/kelch-repeat protein At3g23880-like [Lotus japonicus]|uniref:F-box/kelch-repeat protein At3g23880-like n=1 Tax=Lotus japonicus TaxID=34305 RepID=UPI002582F5FD|nr:F-box/kelch-repeat protein At3g23880-like [Lotus japonicus]